MAAGAAFHYWLKPEHRRNLRGSTARDESHKLSANQGTNVGNRPWRRIKNTRLRGAWAAAWSDWTCRGGGTSAQEDSEWNVALVVLLLLCAFSPRHSMWSRQLNCFAPGLRASFFDPAGISSSTWPRRATQETSDATTPTVIMTSRRRLCLWAGFEVALCGERRHKKKRKGRFGPLPVRSVRWWGAK